MVYKPALFRFAIPHFRESHFIPVRLIANPSCFSQNVHAFHRLHRHRCTRYYYSRYVWEFPAMRNSFLITHWFQVKSCSPDDTTIRCSDGQGKTAWENTQACMDDLGSSRDCYCWGSNAYFATANNNFAEFQACCNTKSGLLIGGWSEC